MAEDLTVTDMAERYLDSVMSCENVKKMVATQMAGITEMSKSEAKAKVEAELDTDLCREE
jgi:hypothetical protein